MSAVGIQKLKLFGSILLIPLGLRTMSICFPVVGYCAYVPMVLVLAGIYFLIVNILELARRMRRADAQPAPEAEEVLT